MPGTVSIGDGYADTGFTITDAGVICANSNLVADGTPTLSGTVSIGDWERAWLATTPVAARLQLYFGVDYGHAVLRTTHAEIIIADNDF